MDANLRSAPQETSQYQSTGIDQLLLFVGDSVQQTVRNRISIQLLYLRSIRPLNSQSFQHKAQTSRRILFAAKEHIAFGDRDAIQVSPQVVDALSKQSSSGHLEQIYTAITSDLGVTTHHPIANHRGPQPASLQSLELH